MRWFILSVSTALFVSTGGSHLAKAEMLAPPAKIISQTEDLEVFSLADGSNLNRFAQGDFIFRLARHKKSGVVYWARRGNPKNIVATVSDLNAISSPEATHDALMTVAELPKICGRDVHTSKVIFVPTEFTVETSGEQFEIGPVFLEGEIRTDRTGATPTELLNFRDYRNNS